MVLGRGVALLYMVVREGLSHKRPKESKRASPVDSERGAFQTEGRAGTKDWKHDHSWWAPGTAEAGVLWGQRQGRRAAVGGELRMSSWWRAGPGSAALIRSLCC